MIASLALPVLTGAPALAPFTGTWKMDAERSESAHQGVPTTAAAIVIRQTPRGFSVETTRSETGEPKPFHEMIEFRLDSSETTNTGDAGVTVTGRARWEGNKLVTETVRNVQDSTVTTLYRHSLSRNGREMTVEKTLTVQHGYQFRGSVTTGSGKDVFVRSSD
ncbi:MAG TPA: hypothetical protein VHB50_19575 [Bryobacteraceae bacterium]|nr:hypothetical protein [Bryobacteraceae bacterium]